MFLYYVFCTYTYLSNNTVFTYVSVFVSINDSVHVCKYLSICLLKKYLTKIINLEEEFAVNTEEAIIILRKKKITLLEEVVFLYFLEWFGISANTADVGRDNTSFIGNHLLSEYERNSFTHP